MGKKPTPVSLLKARRAPNEGKPQHVVAGVGAEAAFKPFSGRICNSWRSVADRKSDVNENSLLLDSIGARAMPVVLVYSTSPTRVMLEPMSFVPCFILLSYLQIWKSEYGSRNPHVDN